MGFLTVGRRFLLDQNEIIDDRIDVVSRGLLGLTVTCARCHDHKFDPIPTDDYYSLYGVFASSVEPAELPVARPARATCRGRPSSTGSSSAAQEERDDYLAAGAMSSRKTCSAALAVPEGGVRPELRRAAARSWRSGRWPTS